jgi:MoaA/NifB/PqqE/SkfB family radical SAM enzyme
MVTETIRYLLNRPVESVRWRRGYAAPPWGIDFLLTDACNLRCSYCPIWGDDGVMPSPVAFMDTGAALRFVEDVAPFRPMLRLFGGEAFLHPEWPTIVDGARAAGLACTAVTNGMRIERDADTLVRSGLLAIGVSVDADGAANDEARGKGTSAKVRRGLEALAEARARHGSDTPRVEVFTTVHEGNYDRLAAWADELAAWPIHMLRLQHLIWYSPTQLHDSLELLRELMPDPAFFRPEEASYTRDRIPEIDLEVLAEQLRALRQRDYPFALEIHPDLPTDEMVRYYGDNEFRRRSPHGCTTMEGFAFVDPRGRLYPCLTLDMGNVFERPFLELWNGARFRSFRRLIRREGRLPLCHRCPDQPPD